jgi:hypothetical protein
MQAQDVRAILDREPFVPLRLVKTDGKALSIPFKHVLLPMKSTVIVFKGIESATSHFAKGGYEHVNYESIDRIEPLKKHRPANKTSKRPGRKRK